MGARDQDPGWDYRNHMPMSRYPRLHSRHNAPMPYGEVQLTCGHTNDFELPPESGKSAYCRRCAAYMRVAAQSGDSA
jgi:hypothetical protein